MDLENIIGEWVATLTDTTTKNPLLGFNPNSTTRSRKTLTLSHNIPLNTEEKTTAGSPPQAVATLRLLEGEKVPLCDFINENTQVQDVQKLEQQVAQIHKLGQQNFEERGLSTIFIAACSAEWEDPAGAQFRAPVFLIPAALTQNDSQWEIRPHINMWEVNPALVQTMEEKFNIPLRDAVMQAQSSLLGRAVTILEHVSRRCAHLENFTITNGLYLTNFSYEKFALVKDIQDAFSAGVPQSNDIVLALAGDIEAARRVEQKTVAVINETPQGVLTPADEYLVLDADEKQSQTISAVLGGATLIIEGPPGTGKSQTIANMIASLTAQGKKVLFVAEKRAAIEAVTQRLERVGLQDIVLDLHTGNTASKHIYTQIHNTLKNNSKVARVESTDNEFLLMQRKQTLLQQSEAVHLPRSPWGVSVFECQNFIAEASFLPHTKLHGESLYKLKQSAVSDVRETLRKFVSLGGLDMERKEKDPWRALYVSGAIEDVSTAIEAVDAIHDFKESGLEVLGQQLGVAAKQTGLPPGVSLHSWRTHFGIWHRVEQVLNFCHPEILSQKPEDLIEAIETLSAPPGGAFLASLTSSSYKTARMKLREFVKSHIPNEELIEKIEQAILLMQDWELMSNHKTRPSLPSVRLEDLWGFYQQVVAELRSMERWFGETNWLNSPTVELIKLLDDLIGQSSALHLLPQLTKYRNELLNFGLEDFLREASHKNLSPQQTVEAFQAMWHASILERVKLTDPIVGAFSEEEHEFIVRDFQDLDREHIANTPAKIRRKVAEQAHLAMEVKPREAKLIRQQVDLKRGWLPPRKFFAKVGDLVTTIKPCWATSPLLVAQLLPHKNIFDVVIFDEASQIRPAEALSAIMRAKQVVIVGDTKQLPPTAFFTGALKSGHDPGDVRDAEGWLKENEWENEQREQTHDSTSLTVRDVESILDAANATFPQAQITLNWHYRSRDEKLIQFSNAHPSLYKWELVTFPGTLPQGCLQHILADAPKVVNDDMYGEFTPEVKRVVQLVEKHALETPNDSLGVITFGVTQAETIEKAISFRSSHNENLSVWLTRQKELLSSETFFIKNLERVQGDERDCVILSIGYGKTPDGKMIYRFGPLNMEGGERRLNVAVTRAKKKMTVVSSFTPFEMEDSKLTSEGLRSLKQYLLYMSSGGEQLGEYASVKKPMTAFEREVFGALLQSGLPVTAQYGTSPQRIPFVLSDPNDKEKMLVAIETDGISYGSSPSVRERDRLRQDHLERLGWTFHRIWSLSWGKDKDKEVEKIRAVWERAVDGVRFESGTNDEKLSGSTSEISAVRVQRSAPKRLPFPLRNFTPGSPVTDYSKMELIDLMRWIESDGLLRTENDLINEAVGVLGFKRKGPAIIKALHEAARTSRYRPGW